MRRPGLSRPLRKAPIARNKKHDSDDSCFIEFVVPSSASGHAGVTFVTAALRKLLTLAEAGCSASFKETGAQKPCVG